jgi:hypothetical protein
MATEASLKKNQCAYCGGKLGLVVQRRWSLRFCSKAHKKAYEHREQEEAAKRSAWLAWLFQPLRTR